jgi:excinuclease ABC subunit C
MFDPKPFVAGLPGLPGVYRMMGAAGELLYVGKAGDLKKRVASYFQKQGLSPRIRMMVSQVAAIDVTVTRSEDEALLLENNLIKSLAPRYNILFRDDKSYPYLMITGHAFPRLGFHRGAKDRRNRHFGPFPHAHAVRESIQLLQRVFRLRTCEDSVFQNRSRPCLLHQIRRCTAPCTGLISAERYAEDVRSAELFLEGREDDVTRLLGARMEEASAAQRYEDAALFRDQMRALSRVQARQYVESERGVDADVVVCVKEDGLACVNLAMIRAGRHVGDRSFFPQNAAEATPAEITRAFLDQHYIEQPRPPLVISAAAARGERRVWVEMAEKNARLALQQRAREKTTQEGRIVALREALGLPETAQRIECFDISHTMGEAAVASCVVYDRHAMQKAQYRRYNMRELTPGDDYAAMRQALARRYERVLADEGRVPDLILIDGGRGQLNAARAALAELGLNDVMAVGVAKGPERKAGMEELVLEAVAQSLTLPPQHPGLHLIQSIRDKRTASRSLAIAPGAKARDIVADRDSGRRGQAAQAPARAFRRPAGDPGRGGGRTGQCRGRQPRIG